MIELACGFAWVLGLTSPRIAPQRYRSCKQTPMAAPVSVDRAPHHTTVPFACPVLERVMSADLRTSASDSGFALEGFHRVVASN